MGRGTLGTLTGMIDTKIHEKQHPTTAGNAHGHVLRCAPELLMSTTDPDLGQKLQLQIMSLNEDVKQIHVNQVAEETLVNHLTERVRGVEEYLRRTVQDDRFSHLTARLLRLESLPLTSDPESDARLSRLELYCNQVHTGISASEKRVREECTYEATIPREGEAY